MLCLLQAFEVAGMCRNGQHAGASGGASVDTGHGDGERGSTMEGCFSCLRIDGEVPTALRLGFRVRVFNPCECLISV